MSISSAWLLATGQSRVDTRLANIGALTPTSPLASRSGVLPGSTTGANRLDGFDLSPTGGMSASVLPGRAVIQGSDSQGAYPVTVNAPVNLTFPDGDPLHNRIDLVVLRVYDDTDHTEATVEIVPGTPAALPTAPALPPLALPLYEVTVKAGSSAGTTGIDFTGGVVGRRTTTVAVGGILPVTTDASPGSYPGQYRDAGGVLQRWDGSAWQPYPPAPVWQSWTPNWTTSTGVGTPSYGNATLNCRYVKNGPTVHFLFQIVFGSSTVFGTGGGGDNWRFSLPVPTLGVATCIGYADLLADTSSYYGARLIARMCPQTTTTFGLEISSGRPDAAVPTHMGLTDSITPWTWVAPNSIHGVGTYEVAP